MDDKAYAMLIARRVYVWAINNSCNSSFAVSKVKESLMQIGLVHIENAIEQLSTEGKVRKAAGGSKRIPLFELAIIPDDILPPAAPVVTGKPKPLKDTKVNVLKRKSNEAGDNVAKKPAVPKTVLKPTAAPVQVSKPIVPAAPKLNPALLEHCYDLMENYTANTVGDETMFTERDFLEKVAAKGFSEDDGKAVLKVWDAGNKVMLYANDDGECTVFRI